jgi:hypothetical protein
MCRLCSKDEEVVRREKALMMNEADNLRRLANKIDLIAAGHINPHSHEMGPITSMARNAIRYLVDEWM